MRDAFLWRMRGGWRQREELRDESRLEDNERGETKRWRREGGERVPLRGASWRECRLTARPRVAAPSTKAEAPHA